MTKQNKLLAPIPVRKYKCPVCRSRIEMTLKEAKEHVNMPIDSPLPIGLIFKVKEKEGRYLIIKNTGRINSNHEYSHTTDLLKRKKKGIVRCLSWGSFPYGIGSSNFKRDLESGEYSLLQKSEFEDFIKSRSAVNVVNN